MGRLPPAGKAEGARRVFLAAALGEGSAGCGAEEGPGRAGGRRWKSPG